MTNGSTAASPPTLPLGNSTAVISPGKWLTLAHCAWYASTVVVAIILLGALPNYYSHFVQAISADLYGLGQFNLPFQVLIALSNFASDFGSFALAILLFWRKPNDRMALLASFFFLITAVVSSYTLDYFLTTYFGAPSTYELWSTLQTPLWILIFCIFPDGRFVPQWTRWVFILSILTSFSIFAGPDLGSLFAALTLPLFLITTFGQVYRYYRLSSYSERKQTRWVVFGIILSMALSVLASIIYKQVSPPLLNVIPLTLTLAILRSRLWDIDILIRKTLTYAIVAALLALVYFSSVILLQQIFARVTGQRSEVITVLSTLAIAALFVPLRNKIQDLIDRRFYRKKYDAQLVLSDFANTVRDETDLDKLTARLVQVVNETMQPASASVWLKPTAASNRRASNAERVARGE